MDAGEVYDSGGLITGGSPKIRNVTENGEFDDFRDDRKFAKFNAT